MTGLRDDPNMLLCSHENEGADYLETARPLMFQSDSGRDLETHVRLSSRAEPCLFRNAECANGGIRWNVIYRRRLGQFYTAYFSRRPR